MRNNNQRRRQRRQQQQRSSSWNFSLALLMLCAACCCDAFRSMVFDQTRPFTATMRDNRVMRRVARENTFATYEMSEISVPQDASVECAALLRPLLKETQLETRPLKIAYDAERDGWDAASFHKGVDGKGATIVVARAKNGKVFGGYNPKGFCSYGGARPSVAAFLFYEQSPGKFQKLQKLVNGKLSCARDDADFGISFGTNDLVIGLQCGQEQLATSKLGEYFECGPQSLSSIFVDQESVELADLKVLVGCYEEGEEIPYSGEVLDSFQFTNGGLEESIFFT